MSDRDHAKPQPKPRGKMPQNVAHLVAIALCSLAPQFVRAQSIVPAADGTGTRVTPEENRLQITGGQVSADGANLFHSFTEFNLTAQQIANFIANPEILNILGRVTGGNASIINGEIGITGANANLFLMNPAGIVFGPDAQLNVPASFLATTATGIGFESGWFNAVGNYNYAALVGPPKTFYFGNPQPGAIANFADLTLNSEQNLTLLGGTILNTGSLTVPRGNITIASVPGTQRVRLSQPHHLLSLEIAPAAPPTPASATAIAPLALPELLTGGEISHATGIRVNGDRTIVLSGSGIAIEPGDIALSRTHVSTDTLEILADRALTLGESQMQATGDVTLKAGETLRVRDSRDRPFLASAGGDLRIQGDRGIDILALNGIGEVEGSRRLTSPFRALGNLTLVSDGIISGDSHFSAGGNFAILQSNGNPGTFISFYDPIVSSEGDVTFGDYTGTSLKVEAGGRITGVNITITGPDLTLAGSDPDIAILTGSAALILRSGTALANAPNLPPDREISDTLFNTSPVPSSAGITVNSLSTAGGPVILSAPGNIVTGNVTTDGGNITATSSSGNIIAAGELRSLSSTGGGNITLEAANTLTLSAVNGGTGNITLTGNEIDLGAPVIGSGILVLQPTNPNRNITLAGTSDSGEAILDITNQELGVVRDGFRNITIGATNGSGTIAVAERVEFTDPLTLRSPMGQGAIAVNDNITLSDNATLAIETAEATILSAGISTEGELTFGNIFLNADIAFSASNITFNGTVDGDRNLSVNAPPGTVRFNQPVGGTTPLRSLTIAAETVELTDDIFTVGNMSFNGAVRLLDNVGLTTVGGGRIAFGGTLDSATNARNNLTLNAPDSTVQFDEAVGSAENGALGAIAVENAANVTAAATMTAEQIILSATEAIALGDVSLLPSSELPAGSVLELIAGDRIAVGNLTAEEGNLRLTSGRSTVTTGDATSSGGDLQIVSESEIATGSLNTASATASGGEISLTSESGAIATAAIDASGAVDGGSVTLATCEACPESVREELAPGIDTGKITANGSENSAGNIRLTAPGDIQVSAIEARGTIGGRLEIATDRVFRAIDTFDDGIVPEASLSVVGSAEEGEMQIRHGSETVQAPFVVGNATTNGTAGALSGAANNTVLPLRSFPFSFTQGNISLLSAAIRPVEPVPDPQPFPTPQESLPEISDDFVNNQLRKPPEIQPIVELEKRQNILGVLPSDRILRERLDLEQNLRLARVRNLPTAIEGIENLRQQEFQNYFQEEFTFQFVSFTDIVEQLQAIATATNTTPAVLYVLSNSNAVDLLLVTPDGEPIHQVVRNANRVQLLAKVQEFSSEIILSARYQNQDYLPLAQQLYQWLIAPIAPTLEARGIDTIAFSMDEGLRLLPVAALHDGEQFLVENYSVGLIPSLNLTDTTYKPLGNLPILAMGASEFTRLAPLPAVSVEIDIIANQLWSGEAFLNEAFTLENLQRQRASEPYKIVHLATHANFQAGNPRNSYIQLWDTQLNLAQLRELGWNDPPLSLLVLSACRTALGSPEAELGFAGLAVQSGAQTAIASLISVSDEGTLALMTQFYQALKTAPIKAEALRQAQLALLNKQVWIEGDRLFGPRGSVPLPSELVWGTQRQYFDHPYYWSAFTVIGSPW